MRENHAEEEYLEDEPFERQNDKTPTDEAINSSSHEVQKERHRHDEMLHTLKTAENLVIMALVLLIIVWLISVWLSKEQQEYTSGVIEILKVVILTTIGFICGNKMK